MNPENTPPKNDGSASQDTARREELIARAKAFQERVKKRAEGQPVKVPDPAPAGGAGVQKELQSKRKEVQDLLEENGRLKEEAFDMREKLRDAENALFEHHNTKKLTRSEEIKKQFELMGKDASWMTEDEKADLRQLFSELDADGSDTLEESERDAAMIKFQGFMDRFSLTADVFKGIGDLNYNDFQAHVEREIRNCMQAKLLTEMRIHRAMASVLPGGTREAPLKGIHDMSDGDRLSWLQMEVADSLNTLLVDELKLSAGEGE